MVIVQIDYCINWYNCRYLILNVFWANVVRHIFAMSDYQRKVWAVVLTYTALSPFLQFSLSPNSGETYINFVITIFLQVASSALGVGPHTAMHLAERLYTQGFIRSSDIEMSSNLFLYRQYFLCSYATNILQYHKITTNMPT